jgi:Spy/CpxP family protein refolding chaperone
MKSKAAQILVVTLAICLSGVMAFSQNAKATGGGQGNHLLSFYTDYLDLTDAQQTQIKAIMTKEHPVMAPMMQQLAQTHSQLRQLEESGAFDEAKARSIAAQQSQTLIDLIVEKSKMKAEMVQVLTADQKAKLQKLESRHEQRFAEHLEGPPPTE